ncbi:MAG: cytochrome c oxidase accessory protein CcoG [Leptothrix ochracea]|uniref:cytochrome c oxidase accessory protein CcoG n=1 Tax=Leptothrix ochracea TaxID=735331 RepID=UPI0034E266DB
MASMIAHPTSSSTANPPPVHPRETIQARSVSGRFSHWRWAMVWLTQLSFYGLPWLSLDGHQALLFDVESRRFFLFGMVLYPQDLIWLTLLLVISALLLFFATALAGRVWCGFACPQTVYTEIFQWLEYRLEGDRHARLRLDASPWTADKLLRRGSKQLAWITLAAWTGFTFVGYFSPILDLSHAALALDMGPWEGFWILLYGTATWLNAGVLREQVCQYMCPYGRFQGSMMDQDTLIVGYDALRGEPRGGRARPADHRASGLGACVDCTVCVQVCPVGIDIRHGVQASCIACGACIDGCNTIMDKLHAPRGLIRFDSPQAFAGQPATPLWQRPRVLIYAGALLLLSTLLVSGLMHRPTLRANVLRDRTVMARQVDGGAVENIYRIQVMNSANHPRQVRLSVNPDDGLSLSSTPDTLHLGPAEADFVVVTLRLNAQAVQAAQAKGVLVRPVQVRLTATQPDQPHEPPEQIAEDSTFLIPR